MTLSSVRRPAWSILAVLALLLWLSLCAPSWWNPRGWRRPPAGDAGAQALARPIPPGALTSGLLPVEDDAPVVLVAEAPAETFSLDEEFSAEEWTDLPTMPGLLAPEFPATVPDSAPTAAERPRTQPRTLIPPPEALLAALEGLISECEAHAWALAAWEEARRLAAAESVEAAAVPLERLRDLAEQPVELGQCQPSVASRVRRAQWAIRRRLDLWRAVLVIGPAPQSAGAPRVADALQGLQSLLAASPHGAGWRRRFALDELAELAAVPDPDGRAVQRLAAPVLAAPRLAQLTAAQRRFLASQPWVALRNALRAWTAEAFSPRDVLAAIERYELDSSAADARLIAEQSRRLFWSSDANLRRLGERLEQRFRNANLRAAVRADLADRLLPEQPPRSAPVFDTVLGVPTRGTSTTATSVSVRFVPDPSRIQALLEIRGLVDSSTRSTSGPASFRSRSESEFLATKPVWLGPGGLGFGPAQVSVDTQLRLLSLRTDFDGVPLVGSLVRGLASAQHAESQPEARAEIRRKVAARSSREIDQQAETRLAQLAERVQRRVWTPLAALGLVPQPVLLSTEAERALARLRLADAGQLAASTPRPQAPADSLASLQVHETAFNNLFEKLALEGREFTLPALHEHLTATLQLPEWHPEEPLADDVVLAFAPHDAVRVRFLDGLVEIRLALAGFAKGPNVWEDFTAVVRYRPTNEGLRAELVREGIIELAGPTLRSADRVRLQVMFNKVFARNKPWQLLGESVANDPRLEGLAVTQFAAEEGWLALAIGGERRPALNVARDGRAVPRRR